MVSPHAPTDAVLPQSVGLMVLTNTSDVTISGLALKEATWLLDDTGYVQAQVRVEVFACACRALVRLALLCTYHGYMVALFPLRDLFLPSNASKP